VSNKSPYFLWDYDLPEKQVKTIIAQGDETTKKWLVARILESANLNDVFRYLKLSQIVELFPQLKLKKPIRQAWERAFKAWGY